MQICFVDSRFGCIDDVAPVPVTCTTGNRRNDVFFDRETGDNDRYHNWLN